MKVLITGAFGSIGESTLKAVLMKEYEVRVFDIKNPKNEQKQQKMIKIGNFETIWGDITVPDDIEKAVSGQDVIIHLAAIIPPSSEKNPELARKVNVEGTKNLIKAAKKQEKASKLIFASSVSIFGPRMNVPPPREVDEPVVATDNYTSHKIECEKIIKESGLPFTVLRLTAVPPLELDTGMDIDILFKMPLDQRIEFVHVLDVGTAFCSAITADTIGKTLLIGGGKDCQLYQREFIKKLLESMGIGMFDESAFLIPEKDEDWFYTDWLDTEESQKLLNYQHHNFDDYLNEFKKKIGFKAHIIRFLRPIIRWNLLKKSPYYKSK